MPFESERLEPLGNGRDLVAWPARVVHLVPQVLISSAQKARVDAIFPEFTRRMYNPVIVNEFLPCFPKHASYQDKLPECDGPEIDRQV